MANIETLWIDNDNLLRVTGVRGGANDVYLNAASAEVTLVDADTGTALSGQSWPLALPYISGSNGDYEVTLPFAIQTTDKQQIRAEVVIDGGAGLRLSIRQPVVASYRVGD